MTRPTQLCIAALLATSPCAAQSIQAIGASPNGSPSAAMGVSADGTTLSVFSGGSVYRWTAMGGFEDIGALSGPLSAAISGDGSTIVGTSGWAYRWSAGTGFEWLRPYYPIATSTNAVSSDGAVIVGAADSETGPYRSAYRWTAAGGAQ